MESWDNLACLEGTSKPLSQGSKQGRDPMPHSLPLPWLHGLDSVVSFAWSPDPPSTVALLGQPLIPWFLGCLLWGCQPTTGQSSGTQSWDFDRIIRKVRFLYAGTNNYKKTAETRIMVARSWGEGEMESCCLMGCSVSILQDKKVLKTCCTAMWVYLTLLNCTLENG